MHVTNHGTKQPEEPMKAATTTAQRPRRENAQSVEFAQVNKMAAAIEASCALRAVWRCRDCRRECDGAALLAVTERGLTPLARLDASLTALLTMDALRCRCGSPAIAMK
jgi:hypothetical protein